MDAGNDVYRLVEAVCDVNLEFVSEGKVHEASRDDAMRQVRQRMLGKVSAVLRPRTSVWNPTIDQLELEIAVVEVRRRLQDVVRRWPCPVLHGVPWGMS